MKKYILPILFASCGLTLAGCKSPAKPTPTPSKTLSSISLSGTYKTEYYVGEELDLTGLVVTAHYSDESSKVVTAYSTSGFDSSEVDDEVVVTVSYTEAPVTKTKDFTVSVAARSQEIHDITLKVTASGINTYEEGHAYIWMSAPILGSATSWGKERLTQDSENANLWIITLEDVTLDEIYEYDLYYGGETEEDIDWTNGKFILDSGEHAFIDTAEGVYEYATNAEFHIPTVTGQVEINYYVVPKVQTEATGTAVAISDYVVVWAWNNITKTTVKLTKVTEGEHAGQWVFNRTVDLLDDKAIVQLTPALGTEEAAGTYEIGDYNDSGVWEKWNNGISFEFTSTITEAVDNAKFNGEPSDVKYTFTLVVKPSWLDNSVNNPKTRIMLSGDFNSWSETDEMTYNSVDNQWEKEFVDLRGGDYKYQIFALNNIEPFSWTKYSNECAASTDNHNLILTVSEAMIEDDEICISATWDTQPEEVVADYHITFNVTLTDDSKIDSGIGLMVDGATATDINSSKWAANLTGSEGTYSYSLYGTDDDYASFAFGFIAYCLEGESNWYSAPIGSYVTETKGYYFYATLPAATDSIQEVVINVSCGGDLAEAKPYLGVAGTCTNATVTAYEPAAEAYTVTVVVNMGDGSNVTGMDFYAGLNTAEYKSACTKVGAMTISNDGETATYLEYEVLPANKEFNIIFDCWRWIQDDPTNWSGGDITSGNWQTFKVVLGETVGAATIVIDVASVVSAGGQYVGVAGACVNCTVSAFSA